MSDVNLMAGLSRSGIPLETLQSEPPRPVYRELLWADAAAEVVAAIARRDALDPRLQFARHLDTKAPLLRLFVLAGALMRRAMRLVWR